MAEIKSKSPLLMVHEFGLKQGFDHKYEFVGEEGRDHKKVFTFSVSVGQYKGHGTGISKKVARYCAAFDLLKQLAEKQLIEPETLQSVALPLDKDREVSKRRIEDGEGAPKKTKKLRRRIRKERIPCDQSRYLETTYYFENGYRKVHPFNYNYSSFAKRRWIGQDLLGVLVTEFNAFTEEAYKTQIINGSTMITKKAVPVDYVIKKGDTLSCVMHRHESAISDAKIDIVHQDDELVVLNKPPSIPSHPCGRIRHNTVVFILAKEHSLPDVKTIHTMDRQASGLLMFGLNLDRARQIEREMQREKVLHKYVCRVKGEFPDSVIDVVKPIKNLSREIRVCKVAPEGKECWTTFKRLSYNGRTSLVQCETHFGRFHQIRVHLQYLGFPILNDLVYNDAAFGPERGKAGAIDKTDQELINELRRNPKIVHWIDAIADLETLEEVKKLAEERKMREEAANGQGGTYATSFYSSTFARGPTIVGDEGLAHKDADCLDCIMPPHDPPLNDLIMYLHTFSFKGPDWEYSVPLPDWAQDDWVEPKGLL